MVLYKYAKFLTATEYAVFDVLEHPGSPTPHSGVYRCEVCGREVASNEGELLPADNHHQHAPNQGEIRWRLAVYAQTS